MTKGTRGRSYSHGFMLHECSRLSLCRVIKVNIHVFSCENTEGSGTGELPAHCRGFHEILLDRI